MLVCKSQCFQNIFLGIGITKQNISVFSIGNHQQIIFRMMNGRILFPVQRPSQSKGVSSQFDNLYIFTSNKNPTR